MAPHSLKSSLDDLLARKALYTLVQPIVDLRNEQALGYEALSRGPNGHLLQRPDLMFQAAQQFDQVEELDSLCLKTAIAHYGQLNEDARLFLNFSPASLSMLSQTSGTMLEFLKHHNLSPQHVVLEVSERFPIENLSEFVQQISALKKLGFGIAIDDLGTGYSGLKLWSEIHPDFVKIDRHFIHQIDQDAVKQSFVSSVIHLCEQLDCEIIAEGIETLGEMNLVRSLGIHFAQGFLLGKPSPIASFAIPKNEQDKSTKQSSAFEGTVEELHNYVAPLSPHTLLRDVGDIFMSRSDLLSIPIVEDGYPTGLIHRWRVLEVFSAQYGRTLHERKPASEFMQQDPLIFDRTTAIETASKEITKDDDSYLRQHFIVTDKGRYIGLVNTKNLLKSITDIQIKKARYANPLTLLPGNVPIDEHIQQLVDREKEFSLAYVDINHFKPFNDQYGYRRGDAVIRWLGQLLEEFCAPSTFIGHVGGDDFVLVFEDDHMAVDCEMIIQQFCFGRRKFYEQEDLQRGYVVGTDRQGNHCHLPLLGLAIGGVPHSLIASSEEHNIAELAAMAKKQAKNSGSSQFIILQATAQFDNYCDQSA